jgi:RNA polymerase sigma-70 factor (ECF subfamily)
MGDQHEAEMARGLRAGRTQAWRSLYDAYVERVWCLAARLMGPVSADVADVVQETFLAAARSAGNYDASRGSLWVWLSGIARKRVALHFRREKRHHRLKNVDGRLRAGRDQIIRWLENRQSTPPAALATAELSSLVRATLAELPAQYETLLTARYSDKVAVEQIAEQEGCSSTAIRSRLARARRAFRRAFTKTSTRSPGAEAGGRHES